MSKIIRVIKPFFDKSRNNILCRIGTEFETNESRANFLIDNKYAVLVRDIRPALENKTIEAEVAVKEEKKEKAVKEKATKKVVKKETKKNAKK